MSPSVWLSLRSGAPGLAGPFLQEFNAAYRHFDEGNSWRPKIIVAIGGDTKRKLFSEQVAKSSEDSGAGNISMRTLPATADALLIDCEMHQVINPPRVLGGPIPGHYSIHCLEGRNSGATPSIIAMRLYSEILSLFSAIVFVFASDFDSMHDVVEFLIQWVLATIKMQTSISTSVYLVVDRRVLLSKKDIVRWISRRLHEQTSAINTTQRRGLPEHMPLSQCLNLQLIRQGTASAFSEKIKVLSASAPEPLYPAGHLKLILKKAIAHFAKQDGSSFNIYLAYSESPCLLREWQHHASDFLLHSFDDIEDRYTILASALVHASPPGIHRTYKYLSYTRRSVFHITDSR